MKRYWTADWHLGSPAIIEYCNRPFRDVEHMNSSLIRNANQRVKDNDTLISVGDMISYGRAKGVDGLRLKHDDYASQINGTFVNVAGNHDDNNHVKSICDFMMVKIGKMKVSISHMPTSGGWANDEVELIGVEGKSIPAFHICGHVHTAWKHQYRDSILNINVGCDQWNYHPVSDEEILRYIVKNKLL